MSGGGRDLLAVRNLGSSAIQDLVAVDGLEKIPLLLCQMAGWVAGSKWVRVVLGVGLGCRQEVMELVNNEKQAKMEAMS